MIAAIATRAGSGSFFTFQRIPTVTSAISAVISSTMDRSASTITVPVIAPIAAAVTPSTNGNQVPNEANRDDDRAGRDHGDGDGVNELPLGQPLMVMHHATIQKWLSNCWRAPTGRLHRCQGSLIELPTP